LFVQHLTLHNFRSYDAVDIELGPGVTAFIGRNGQGKTNIVEAIDYLSRLASHRVATDAPLVRHGTDQAVVRASVVRDDRTALLEIEINPGRSNRARINKSPLPRARELLGLVRTVLFSPEDLALVKGDPSDRRRFLDDLLVLRAPRYAGVRSDYDRILKQRNALLKAARANRRGRVDEHFDSTLAVWNGQLARVGAELLAARLFLVDELKPLVASAYAEVARDASSKDATMAYQPSFALENSVVEDPGLPDVTRPALDRHTLTQVFEQALDARKQDEIDRGLSLVGPHRDELVLTLGPLPMKGYASHGESWSFALALRLASYELLKAGGDDPILILDDVFAELDTDRRDRLAELVSGAEQVLVTAAVPKDVPVELAGARFEVANGKVTPA
jgi:DNA replication and repair protein RecF